MHLGSLYSPQHQRPEEQGDGTVEAMHPDFRVGPMVHGPPAARGTILHLLEHVLDDELAAIGFYDLGVIPRRPIADNDVLAQMGVGEI